MAIDKHIVLIGFMGAGKTTIGRELSGALRLPFFDNDAWVRAESGLSIPKIFENEGEKGFRTRESVALLRILQCEVGVVSTGGGIVSTILGRETLKECGADIVFLRVGFETAESRVQEDPDNIRPLFEDLAIAKERFYERQPWYEEVATFTVEASGRVDFIVNKIVDFAQA